MSIARLLAAQPSRLWRFLGFFQGAGMRTIHALVAGLCILQLFSSMGMDVYGTGASPGAWYHMWGGASLCLLAVVQITLSFRKHGLRHFYPYLWKDMDQLEKDVKQSLRLKLVPPRPKGLGAVVQGLGLGALFLTAFTGLFWFVLWQSGSANTEEARAVHDGVSLLIILYLIGHGGMALLHFIVWEENSRRTDT